MAVTFIPAAQQDMEESVAPAKAANIFRRSPVMVVTATAGAALASVLGVVMLVDGVARSSLGHNGPRAINVASAPLTVRSLLASDEVKDVTTDNLLALHGSGLAAEGRQQLRERVGRGLSHIDGALEQMEPEAHKQIGELTLTEAQKELAMNSLRKFGDARMVRLASAIDEVVNENARDVDGTISLQRRLSEKFSDHIDDIMQLNSEMLPKKIGPAWRPELDMGFESAGHASASAVRRLTVLDGVNSGINAHVQALFESLEGDMGEKMPRAPARMLGMMDMLKSMSDPKSSQTQSTKSGSSSLFGGTTSGSTQQNKEQSFMACVSAAVPNPSKFAKCVMDNMSEVVSMMMKFMKGGS